MLRACTFDRSHPSLSKGDVGKHNLVLQLPTELAGHVYWKKPGCPFNRWNKRYLMLKSQALVIVSGKVKSEAEIDWKAINFWILPLRGTTTFLSSTAKKKSFGFMIQFTDESLEKQVSLCTSQQEQAIRWVEMLIAASRPPRLEDFDVISRLGQGGSGDVFLVSRKDTEKLFALKVIRKKNMAREMESQRRLLANERAVLQSTSSPFTDHIRFAFQTSDYWFLVMDLAEGGDLIDHLKRQKECRFSEEGARFYAAQLVLGVFALHKSRTIHRDLKPENILVDVDGYLRICDFGLAKRLENTFAKAQTFCGTGRYLAPEVLTNVGGGYAKEVDWWGVGQLVYVLLFAHAPFHSSAGQQATLDNIRKAQLKFPSSASHLSRDCRDFIAHLLQRDPKRRLGSGPHGQQRIMQHPWFHGIDWLSVQNKTFKVPESVALPKHMDRQELDTGEEEEPEDDGPEEAEGSDSHTKEGHSHKQHKTSNSTASELSAHPAFLQALSSSMSSHSNLNPHQEYMNLVGFSFAETSVSDSSSRLDTLSQS